MEGLATSEYPDIPKTLQPNQAVQCLNDRVRCISKINVDIADWLQERRRVEEQYVLDLRRLARFETPNGQSDLGVFAGPWARLVESVEFIAESHQQFAEAVEKDIEQPLRAFPQQTHTIDMSTISDNLASVAKSLEDAQDKSETVGKRGGKKLEKATKHWNTESSSAFTSLQEFDKSRIDQLRSFLVDYQTHEIDCTQKTQNKGIELLSELLEVSTEAEMDGFVYKATQGTAELPARTPTRQSSVTGTPTSTGPPSTGRSATMPPLPVPATPTKPEREDPAPLPEREPKPASKLRRLGTLLSRRRQSMHAGIGMSQQKTGSFGRLSTPKEPPGILPKASSGNLQGSGRLGDVSEMPDRPRMSGQDDTSLRPRSAKHRTNGTSDNVMDTPIPSSIDGSQQAISPAAPPADARPHTSHGQPPAPPAKDSEGFTIPAPMNDPISEAQRGATSEGANQPLKVIILTDPIKEDHLAREAAWSNLSKNLSKMGPATQQQGSPRGNRTAPNTNVEGSSEATSPVTSGPQASSSFASSLAARSPAFAALASQGSVTGASDNRSVKSSKGMWIESLVKARHTHPEMSGPGLRASIIETASAVFENSEIKSTSITGEIALVNNSSSAANFKEKIRINSSSELERIESTDIISNAVPSTSKEFIFDTTHINKTGAAFSYRLSGSDSDLAASIPLLLYAEWQTKDQIVEEEKLALSLFIYYRLNPAWNGRTSGLTLHNVVFIATYEGEASNVKHKSGLDAEHVKKDHLVRWLIGDLALSSKVQRAGFHFFYTEGPKPTQGHIEASWEYQVSAEEEVGSGIGISRREENPFADDGSSTRGESWVDVPLVRKLVSGRYGIMEDSVEARLDKPIGKGST